VFSKVNRPSPSPANIAKKKKKKKHKTKGKKRKYHRARHFSGLPLQIKRPRAHELISSDIAENWNLGNAWKDHPTVIESQERKRQSRLLLFFKLLRFLFAR
jgi:hypothetical protein